MSKTRIYIIVVAILIAACLAVGFEIRRQNRIAYPTPEPSTRFFINRDGNHITVHEGGKFGGAVIEIRSPKGEMIEVREVAPMDVHEFNRKSREALEATR